MSGVSPKTVVSVENVSKKFCKSPRNSLWYSTKDLLREVIGFHSSCATTLRKDEFFALQDVSFTLHGGESLAIMGHNGAGKTTLLKLLIGRLKPTAGRITTQGQVGAITELGLGFDPALSGRENIHIGGALMGLSRRRINELMDRIIEFAEIGVFIDAAVKTYSTGMRARLGFSIAAHVNPEVLLVDEALAVGDIGFRRKCIRHVKEFLREGGALLWVSHDPYLVQAICQRCIVLEHGKIVFDGSAIEGVERYLRIGYYEPVTKAARFEAEAVPPPMEVADSGVQRAEENQALPCKPSPSTMGLVVIEAIHLSDALGGPPVHGRPVLITLDYLAPASMASVRWGFIILTADLTTKVTCAVSDREGNLGLTSGRGRLHARIPALPLRAGNYAIQAGIIEGSTGAPVAMLGWESAPAFFSVTAEISFDNNIYGAVGDLVALEVDWTNAEEPGRKAAS